MYSCEGVMATFHAMRLVPTLLTALLLAFLLLDDCRGQATEEAHPSRERPLYYNAQTGNIQITRTDDVPTNVHVPHLRKGRIHKNNLQETSNVIFVKEADPAAGGGDQPVPGTEQEQPINALLSGTNDASERCIFCGGGGCPDCYRLDPSGVCRPIFGCQA